jgi:hypothetical protein
MKTAELREIQVAIRAIQFVLERVRKDGDIAHQLHCALNNLAVAQFALEHS